VGTVRVTAAQALVRFLVAQHVERDGIRQRFFGGCFGIFGHGNVAGLGEALLAHADQLRYHPARNEQGMVHAAVGYARMKNRLGAFACTSSIGPGATNMLTGAAVATINRLPVLLLPGDVFSTHLPDPVLQQLENTSAGDVSVNDCFRPVSRYFDRVWRPEQVMSAAMQAMRVLTSPAETGAVTLAFPQDVQAEAFDCPEEFLAERTWHVPRAQADPDSLARAVDAIRGASRPLIVAGGGVIYSGASDQLRAFCEATGVPVGETQAGKGSLPYDHPSCLGAIGATGTFAANRVAAEADVVIGIGTRYSDFTTASKTAFRDRGVRFVNVNVADFDAAKQSGVRVVADARAALEQLTEALDSWSVGDDYRAEAARLNREWDEEVTRLYSVGPGDLHKLWRTRDPKGYHVEYGYSCMGYEIAGGLGVKLAAPEREVYVLVGDGSYLMLSSELVTAVQEDVKLTVVLVDSHGFNSIGALSRSLGLDGFGTQHRYARNGVPVLDGDEAPPDQLPVDLAVNAASLGVETVRVESVASLRAALEEAKQATRTTVIVVEVDRYAGVPGYESWWDVPVAEVSDRPEVRRARAEYEAAREAERRLL